MLGDLPHAVVATAVRGRHRLPSISHGWVLDQRAWRAPSLLARYLLQIIIRQLLLHALNEIITAQINLLSKIRPHIIPANARLHEITISRYRSLPGAAKLAEQPIRFQPGRRRLSSNHQGIAAPKPVSGFTHHASPYGVEHNISRKLQKIAVLINKHALVSALIKMAYTLIAPIYMLGINTVKLTHASRQVGIWCLDNQVVM